MRAHRVAITFPKAFAAELWTHIDDFAFELDQALRAARKGRVEDRSDFRGGHVYVAVISDGKLRPALAIIKTTLEAHLLDSRSTVTVISEAET